MLLTEISIKALKPPATGQITYTDDTLPGFGVRVSKGGLRTFVVVHGRNRQRTTLGRYPTISLQQARKAAREVLAERTLGKRNAPTIKFQEAVNSYISTHFPEGYLKPRTRRDTERLLNRHFLPSLRHEKLADIQTHNISRVIDRLKSSPSEARHAFVAARQFFNWAVGRRYIDRNPCQGLNHHRLQNLEIAC